MKIFCVLRSQARSISSISRIEFWKAQDERNSNLEYKDPSSVVSTLPSYAALNGLKLNETYTSPSFREERELIGKYPRIGDFALSVSNSEI